MKHHSIKYKDDTNLLSKAIATVAQLSGTLFLKTSEVSEKLASSKFNSENGSSSM